MAKNLKPNVEANLSLVRERLEFVEIISQLNAQFLNPGLIRHPPEGGWTHPWIHFDSLRNYLLLTCFDLLGQPSEFKDFQSWLRSSSAEREREAVLASIDVGAELTDIVAQIHRSYLDIHGTKVSFYRFVNDVLPIDMRKRLLHSVQIRRIDPGANREIETVGSENHKIKALFTLRNLYTHQAINIGSPGGGVWDFYYDWHIRDGVPMKGYDPILYEHKSGTRIEYGVRDWPNVLLEVVRAGIVSVEASPD